MLTEGNKWILPLTHYFKGLIDYRMSRESRNSGSRAINCNAYHQTVGQVQVGLGFGNSKLNPLNCSCILGEDPLCEVTRSIALELGLIKTKITTQTVADEQVMKPPPTQRGGESFIRESERRIATPRRRGRPRKEVPPPQKSTLERYLSVKPSMKVEALTITQPTKWKQVA